MLSSTQRCFCQAQDHVSTCASQGTQGQRCRTCHSHLQKSFYSHTLLCRLPFSDVGMGSPSPPNHVDSKSPTVLPNPSFPLSACLASWKFRFQSDSSCPAWNQNCRPRLSRHSHHFWSTRQSRLVHRSFTRTLPLLEMLFRRHDA
jgi:hypothetical protein